MTDRVLVTGGAGFIGSHLVEALLARGQSVRVLDNFSTGRRENLHTVRDRIELITGDLRDPEMVARALSGVRWVFHQAALVSMSLSVTDPLLCHQINESGTLSLLIAARDAGVEKVVIASSAAVYGNDPTLPKRESQTCTPASPYGWSKRACEMYGAVFSELYGLSVTCLRYFNVFGPRQDPASPYAAVIPIFATRMAQSQAPTIFGDGAQTRDFVFIEDVVRANLLAAEAQKPGPFNVATGRTHSLLDLVAILNRVLDRSIEPHFEAPRPGDIRDSSADATLIRDELGFEAQVGFEDGLRRLVASLPGARSRGAER